MPRSTAFTKLTYTAKVYNYTQTTDSTATNTRTYAYFKDIKLDVQQTVFGKLNIILPDDSDDIMQRARLHEVKDKFGNEIYPGGIFELQGVMPIMTNFGKREGYRSVAQLYQQTLPSV